MLDNYSDIWRQVILRCPAADPMLAQSWVKYAFRRVAERRRWSWLMETSQFLVNNVINSGNVDVVYGSDTITGHSTGWTAAIVGRQFRIGLNYPIYTVTAVDEIAQTMTIDDVWGGDTLNGENYQIYNAYLTVPSDFYSFVSVYDPAYNWQLWTQIQQAELNSWDAQRANQGTAWVVAELDYNTAVTPPIPRYEIWPHQLAQKPYPFLYQKQAQDISDVNSSLPRYIRGDVLMEGALAEAAKWPGPSSEKKNPYFNLGLAQMHTNSFEKMVMELEVKDNDIYQMDVMYPFLGWPQAPVPWADSRWLQSHAPLYV